MVEPKTNQSAEELSQVMQVLHRLDAKVDNVCAMLNKSRKELLTVDEFGEIVGRTPYTVRQWIQQQKIKAIRVQGTGPRGRLLIPHSELDRVVRLGHGASVPDTAVN